MNDEQAREAFHATHDSVYAMIEHLQMTVCNSIFCSYSKLIHLCGCGFCLCGVRSGKFMFGVFLELKELLKLLQRCWVGTAGPIPW